MQLPLSVTTPWYAVAEVQKKTHRAHQVLVSALGAGLGADHEADGLVEHVYLVRLQVLETEHRNI